MADKETIRKEYESGKYTFKQLADKFNISQGTIKSWAKRDKDNGQPWKKVATKTKNQNKKVATEKEVAVEEKEPVFEEVQEVLNNPELTDKQRLFCSYYAKYRNKTKAYMKAYKCSWENANAHAYELWKNVGVRKEIDKLLKEIRDNIKIDIQDLIQINIDIAFADINDYVEFGQEVVPVMGPFGPIVVKEKGKPPQKVTKVINVVRFKESSEVDGTIISEVKQGKDGASIKLQDKMKAISFLEKHIEYLDDSVKERLEIENKRLQNEKLKTEINRITGQDEPEVEDDGFLEALKGRTAEVWNDE